MVSAVKFAVALLGDVNARYSMSKPTVLPAALTSVSWMPCAALPKPIVPFCTAVNFSVCAPDGAAAAVITPAVAMAPAVTTAPAAAISLLRCLSMVVSSPVVVRWVSGLGAGSPTRDAMGTLAARERGNPHSLAVLAASGPVVVSGARGVCCHVRGRIGRDAELGVLEAFLAGLASAPAVLVLAGVAGAGKTTLLRAGLERAAGLGYTVLRTVPSQSDMRLAFAGLADLLGARLDAVLPELPVPQRRALGAALLIEDAPPVPPEPRVIAAAFRTALLVLAASAPVLVVIDDVQWLDAPTGSAVGFALRRLEAERVGLLCAQRTSEQGSELPLELDRARLATEVMPVGGLSLGALHRLLRTRLGMALSAPGPPQGSCGIGGQPFHRAGDRPRARPARHHPGRRRAAAHPGHAQRPGRRTAARAAGPVADALGVVAVMPGAPLSRYLAAGVNGGDLDAAVLAGVLEVDAGTLRFSHPLLASAVLGPIPPARRRQLHALAAQCATAGARYEWCINSAVADPADDSVIVNSEDGTLYRWDLARNTLAEKIHLNRPRSEAYTPTIIGPDGTVYAINNATLYAIGR